MKNNAIGLCGAVLASVALCLGQPLVAGQTIDPAKALAGVSVLDVPAKAASLVSQAVEAEKIAMAESVVKAAVRLHPTADTAIVGAVAQTTPKSAPIAAVTAATLQHKRLDLIVKAAAAAAPAQASKIVTAMIREFPADYGVIAVAAAEGAPEEGRAILSVVADYVPALQPAIEHATASFSPREKVVPVQAVLMQSYNQTLKPRERTEKLAQNSASAGPGTATLPTPNVVIGTAYKPASAPTPMTASAAAVPPQPTTAPASGGIGRAGDSAGMVATPTIMPVTQDTQLAPPTLGSSFVPILGPPFGSTNVIRVITPGMNYSTPGGGRTP